MQNKIIKNKPKNYKELKKIIIQTAIEETGLFNNKNNEVYSNKKVKEARKLKIKAKKEYEMAMRIKSSDQIKNKLGQYRKHQINLTNITNDYEIKTTKSKLKVIISGRTNSKRFCNLIRQIKKSNAEDLYAVKNQNGEKTFIQKTKKKHRTLIQRNVFKKNIINMPQVLA